MSDHEHPAAALEGVAIIGMAGRFPGARSVAESVCGRRCERGGIEVRACKRKSTGVIFR